MILDRLRRKKKETAPSISRGDFLRIIPVPNPKIKWEKDESNNITLILQREEQKDEKKEEQKEKPERPRRKKIFSTSTPEVRQKKIHLDTVGSIVWELCDGKRTTKDIAEQLRIKYKMLPSEAEISLNSYFNDLAKRGLVAFFVPEEVVAKFDKKETKEEKKQSIKK